MRKGTMKMFLAIFATVVISSLVKAQNPTRYYRSAEKTVDGLVVLTSEGTYKITPYFDEGIEVEFFQTAASNPPSLSLAISPEKLEAHFLETNDEVEYLSGNMRVLVEKSPLKISYFHKGKYLFSEEMGFFDNDSIQGFRFNLSENEKIMGGGERVLGMDRRGHRLQLYNRASYGYETHADLMYYSLPIAISSEKYMLVFDNGASGYMDIGKTESDIMQFEATGGRMSYWVVASDKWDGLTENFTQMCGRQPMLPRWALGNIASRFGYHSQQEVENVVDTYIEQDIPLDAIVLDLYWFGKEVTGTMGNLEWHTDSFPNPEKMMAGIKEKGVKTILITEPFILSTSGKYKETAEQDLLGTNLQGEPYLYDFFFGNTALLDVFKQDTKDWFWEIYKKHTLSGVSGWWGDLGEPEVHPDDLMHVNGKAEDVHNYYGHEWAKTVYQGFEKDFPNRRPVILMRSGFVGSQRYGLVPWTGDVNRTWGGLKPQVELSLSMGMQGLAYTHSDLGGFAGALEDSELYIRWLQYGVFQPIYRPHAQEEVPSEPIFWDDTTKNIVREFIKLRYALTPYTYTLVHENATTGLPMMRPLFYVVDNPDLLEEKDTYLWGDNFLVSPVVEKGQKNKDIYLPENAVWIDYWTRKEYTGGQEINVALDINTIPVFVKAGSFIPMVPSFQNMEEYNSDKLYIHYYHHSAIEKAEGYLYEDDGETKEAYKKEQYEILRFNAEQTTNGLQLMYTPEGFDHKGKPKQRTVQFIIHGFNEKPKHIYLDEARVKVTSNHKKFNKKDEGAFWNAKDNRLEVKFQNDHKPANILIK